MIEEIRGKPIAVRGRHPDLTIRDQSYYYRDASFYTCGHDLYVRMYGQVVGTRWLLIRNYRELTALGVIAGTDLGRHFEDGVLRIWHQEGLPLGYVAPRTRKMEKPEKPYEEPEMVQEETGQLALMI